MAKWHGYAALRRPDGVGEEQWDQALALIYADLDESPEDDQPARRLHTAQLSDDSVLVESVYDTTKLHTDYVRSLTAISPNIVAYGVGFDWQFSRSLAQGCIKNDWNIMSRIFYPEDYGAVGDGATDDTAAVQATIDAASMHGGHVSLSRRYVVSHAGATNFGMYTNVGYALWINADNVIVDGPGVLILETLPSIAQFCVIAFGNGGTDDPQQRPLDDGTWTYNVHLKNVTFDLSAFTKQQLQQIGDGPFSGCIMFAYCQNFSIVGCTVLNGYGSNGAITAHVSSKFGHICGNRVFGAAGYSGFWLDGIRGSVISNNVIAGDLYGIEWDVNGVGIAIAANSDNTTNAGHCLVSGNALYNCKGGGIAAIGSYHHIAGNRISTKYAGNGIAILVSGNELGEFASNGVAVTGNSLVKEDPANYGIAIKLAGLDVGGYDGSPIPVTNALIHGNVIGDKWLSSIVLGQSAIDNKVVCNIAPDGIAIEDGVTTATGNTTEPNY